MKRSTMGNAAEVVHVANDPDFFFVYLAPFPEYVGLVATRNADVPCVCSDSEDQNIVLLSIFAVDALSRRIITRYNLKCNVHSNNK
jgi:hypothetical protein